MNKLMWLAAVAAMCSAVAPAEARNGAWYVGGDFGGMLIEDTNFDFGALPPSIPSGGQLVVNHDYGYDGALFVGYDLGAFRLEAEASYKRAAVDDIEASVVIPGLIVTPDTSIPAGGRTSALSFMVNGMLDFGDDDGISGFVGGGIGVARVDYNAFRRSPAIDVVDQSDTRFAWQVVAGLRQAISDNIDITVRYRFFRTAGGTLPGFGGNDYDASFGSHSLLAGIIYNFNIPGQSPPPLNLPPPAPASETPVETPH